MSIDHDKKHCESMHGQFPCPMSTHDPDNKECATRKTFAEGYTASCDCPSPEVREEKCVDVAHYFPEKSQSCKCGKMGRNNQGIFLTPSTEEEKRPQVCPECQFETSEDRLNMLGESHHALCSRRKNDDGL
ncbi:MAG: hypothetical protein Q7K40_03830, partial [bacterium]|nr:hypothetical protein [bacterium]